MAQQENIWTLSTHVTHFCFANKKNLSAIVKICFGTIVMLEGSYIGWVGNGVAGLLWADSVASV